MYQNSEDQLLYSSSKVQFYQDIRRVIRFYFYHHFFRILYNYLFQKLLTVLGL